MAQYNSYWVDLRYSADQVFSKLSNLENLRDLLNRIPEDQIPADQRKQLEDIQITPDSISLPGGPVGSITLRMAEKVQPSLIRLQGEGTPVNMSLSMEIEPVDDAACRARVVILLDIPAMLKPMVNGPLNKMTEQFATMLQMIRFD